MEFLFRSREPGKRQVKPSQDIALLEDQVLGGQNGESSDDSEYKLEDDKADKDKDSAASSSDSSSDDSSSDSDEDNLENLKKELETTDLLELAAKIKAETEDGEKSGGAPQALICGVCLGSSSSDADEIVECDGCGVSVHEGCYGVTDTGSVSSTISEASTEPWFCEPCKAGLIPTKPPSCELCPTAGGLYKQTDVGRWVHLICALYTPGVAFGEPDRLTMVTIFEMNYSNWGKRTCMLCAEPRMSRTGVCIGCDAGMCKANFHVTCAQANGLLQEPSYESDPYLAHCKVHTDKTVAKGRKHAYLTLQLGTRKKNVLLQARHESTPAPAMEAKRDLTTETADQRILRKLSRQQLRFKSELGKRTAWVPTQKIGRLLTTSASAVRKIQRMGEIQGVSVERQLLHEQQVLSVMDVKKKWHVPPTLSVDFVAYYLDRQKRIDDLRSSLSVQIKEHSKLRGNEAQLRPKFELTQRLSETGTEKNENLRSRISKIRDTLSMLSPTTYVPPTLAMKPIMKPLEIVTPNVKARATLWSQNQIHKQLSPSSSGKSPVKMSLKSCALCSKTKDQHLLAHCDTCRLYYHLGCLTPPLTRMPKKSKQYGWQCSECDKDSDSDEKMTTEEAEAPRKKRQAAARALLRTSRHNSDEWEDSSWAHLNGGNHQLPKAKSGGSTEVAAKAKFEEDISEATRQSLIASASSSVMHSHPNGSPSKVKSKEERRAEKDKRRAEKKRKKEKKKKKERERLEREGNEPGSDDLEIIEDENGCTVRIKPKTIKLKIKATASTMPPPSELDFEESSNSNGGVVSPEDASSYLNNSAVQHQAGTSAGDNGEPPAKKGRRKSAGKDRDVRNGCDKCGEPGQNSNLVRCDECKRCFHFTCLVPPVKKSPKVAGYSWHCSDCDPSEVDSDWHLD